MSRRVACRWARSVVVRSRACGSGPGELLGDGAAEVVELVDGHVDEPVALATDGAEGELDVTGELAGADVVHPFDRQLALGGGTKQQDQERAGIALHRATTGIGPQRSAECVGGTTGVDDMGEQVRTERRLHAALPIPRSDSAASTGSGGSFRSRWASRSGSVLAVRSPAAGRSYVESHRLPEQCSDPGRAQP